MLDGQTAFVTGASQGIGREIAISLSAKGANVALAARSDDIYETAALASEQAGVGEDQLVPVETDVSEEQSVESSIDRTVEKFGELDCLVNNAGIGGPVQPFDRFDETEFTETLDVNTIGVWRCVKHAGEYLRDSEQGSVINIGSIGGKRPYPNRVPYAASKMALVGMTRALAHELGSDEVTVNLIQPGPVQGERINQVLQKQAALADVPDAEPLQITDNDFAFENYLIEPDDIAEMVAYLAGPHARMITGQEIAIDAGGSY